MFRRFVGAIPAILLLGSILLSPTLGQVPTAKDESRFAKGIISFKSEHGMVILPKNVTGVLFNYEGLNSDSLRGDALDLSLITEAFIYPDRIRYNASKDTLDDFQLNSIAFTDALLKWRISKMEQVFPGAVEHDTVKINWQGKTVIVSDLSQWFNLFFADSCNVHRVVIDIGTIKQVKSAEPYPIWRNY